MKTLLAAALALIAVPAHAGWLDNSFGSQPAGLQCETSVTTKQALRGYNSTTETKGTMLIKLEGDQWRFISMDGSPLPKSMDKPSPLRTTDATYYLSEDRKFADDAYDYDFKAMTINRVTGELATSSYTVDKRTKWLESEITTGHCTPTDLAPKL
jgi:hypothetical protein